MTLPERADCLIIGAGIHGLSTAWHLAERWRAAGRSGRRIVVLDKTGPGAGASGIACGVVRNNYYQPAMRALMAHSVAVWESDPEAFAYHPVGYLQISPEPMRAHVETIYAGQQELGYASELIEGAEASHAYMRRFFGDWQARGITSVLHEKRGGFAHNTGAVKGLADKARAAGVEIVSGVAVTGFALEDASGAVASVQTDQGTIACGEVVLAPGPWVGELWRMLALPETITVTWHDGTRQENVPMWHYRALQEGVLDVPPERLRTESGTSPPVLHVDSDAPLYAESDGRLLTDAMWGIYYKPDSHFGGVQGGTVPKLVDRPASEVRIDPYGPASPEFVVDDSFAELWVSALAHCHGRFAGCLSAYRRAPSGGLGAFTPDSFPVFDRFRDNAYVIADSNHGFKMIGVGALVAEELMGGTSELLEPFRFSRYATGDLHPVSNSPFPWS